MDILTFPLGELQANCYILIKGSECLIIDPGDEGSFLLEEISRRNLTPLAILATHGHFDHLMAVGEIQMSFDIPLYMGKDDMFLVDRLRETAAHFLGYKPVMIEPRNISHDLKNNMKLGSFSFEVIKTPGHTPGGVSFYFKKDGVVFTGDTLFKGTVGRWDFKYCDKNDLKKSVEKLLKLSEGTQVLSGHGEETLIQSEKDIISIFSKTDL